MKVENDMSYEEYLEQTHKEPRPDELNDMEKAFCKASLLKSYQKPLNNPYYQPLQGA